MSVTTIPPGGLSLHAIPHGDADQKQPTTPAVLFKLSEELLQDVQKAANGKDGLSFVTGAAPKIRLGKRTIDLSISSEAFRHELFSASTENLGSLEFAGIVGHRAELKAPERKQSLGSDAALAALQNSLASYHQEKAAKSVNYTGSVIAAPKNRFEANREQKYAHRRGLSGSHHGNTSISASATPHLGGGPTSVPGDFELKLRAMRKPLIHLLAIKPLTRDGIVEKTKIPKDDLEEVLQKVGKPSDGKWTLSDRAFKELDVWKFAYSTQTERQEAIDNAVRAYDRQRIGKEEKIWQMLLPKEKRDQGIYLSKLAIGAGMTPNVGGSPLHPGDVAGDEKAGSVATTPRLGAGTPKVGAGKNDLMKKLAKNPKQRAIEEAKEKKRKEREAAAAVNSDKEGKPVRKKQATVKNNNPKVKSAELVQSSSESESGEIKAASTSNNSSQSRSTAANATPNAASGKTANNTTGAKAKPRTMAKTNASAAASASSSDAAREKPTSSKTAATSKPKIGTPSSKPASAVSSATKTKPAPLGKSTPNGLHAPSSQHRSQLSPNKPHHRPTAPSPLGAARPRVASDVSDRGAIGIQRVKQGGGETPKGLGISNVNGLRKRHDTVTSTDSSSSSKMNGENSRPTTARKTNGTSTPKTTSTNGNGVKSDNALKRKHIESPAREDRHPVKHRKTESTSSHSQNSSNSVGANSSNADGLERSLSSDSASSVRPQLSYNQGVREAQRFHEELYPRYTKLYDEQVAMERRGERVPREDRQRLWAMHRRLELMKREIRDASLREQQDV